MPVPSLEQVQGLWEPDGSLRDIYVFGTTESDWRSFLELTTYNDSRYYRFNGEEQSMPSVADIFSNREGTHLFAFELRGVWVHCHFFIPTEIELDLQPREVKGQAEHEAILNFAQSLSEKLGKTAFITPENGPETPYLSFDPERYAWTIHS
jgi:hypothetical protein